MLNDNIWPSESLTFFKTQVWCLWGFFVSSESSGGAGLFVTQDRLYKLRLVYVQQCSNNKILFFLFKKLKVMQSIIDSSVSFACYTKNRLFNVLGIVVKQLFLWPFSQRYISTYQSSKSTDVGLNNQINNYLIWAISVHAGSLSLCLDLSRAPDLMGWRTKLRRTFRESFHAFYVFHMWFNANLNFRSLRHFVMWPLLS